VPLWVSGDRNRGPKRRHEITWLDIISSAMKVIPRASFVQIVITKRKKNTLKILEKATR
jgi:hypothetical protein